MTDLKDKQEVKHSGNIDNNWTIKVKEVGNVQETEDKKEKPVIKMVTNGE
jgi:hypothetical protein